MCLKTVISCEYVKNKSLDSIIDIISYDSTSSTEALTPLRLPSPLPPALPPPSHYPLRPHPRG